MANIAIILPFLLLRKSNIENYYCLPKLFLKESMPITSTFGNGIDSNILKCLSSVTIYRALAVIAQSTNLLSSLSASINPKL